MKRLALMTVIAVLMLGSVPTPASAQHFGHLGVTAEVGVRAEGFGPGVPAGFGDFFDDFASSTTGAAQSSYDWPPPSGDPIPGGMPACPATGCASWHARAFARADPTGLLRAYASASIRTGGYEVSNAGYNMTWAIASLGDTITLSAPATVRLEGRVRGSLISHHSHIGWYGDPQATLSAHALFRREASNETGWDLLGGLSEQFEPPVIGCPYPNTCLIGPDVPLPQARSVDEPFAIDVALPAGTTAFDASLRADIDILVWGAFHDDHRDAHSASALLDALNSLEFRIVVPDDVVAISGSGLLPIVGGASAADTTAPSITCDAPDGEWHAQDVSIACSASDSGSGLADPADVSFTLATIVPAGTETADAQTSSRQVCDVAGNCTTAGPLGGHKVDKKAPDIGFAQPAAANANGWHNTDVAIPFTATDGGSGVAGTDPTFGSLVLSREGTAVTGTVTATDAVGNSATATSPAVRIDKTSPVVSYTANAGTYTVDQSIAIACAATDALSGIDSHNCTGAAGPAYEFFLGTTTLSATALDRAGNTGAGSTSFSVVATFDSLGILVERFIENAGLQRSLVSKLEAAAASSERGAGAARDGQLDAFVDQLRAQSGRQISAEHAALLERLAEALR